MSAQGMAATIVWTELLEALRADHPGLALPNKAGPATTKVIHKLVEGSLDNGTRKSPWVPVNHPEVDMFEVLAERVRAGEPIHITGPLDVPVGQIHLATIDKLRRETGLMVQVIYSGKL